MLARGQMLPLLVDTSLNSTLELLDVTPLFVSRDVATLRALLSVSASMTDIFVLNTLTKVIARLGVGVFVLATSRAALQGQSMTRPVALVVTLATLVFSSCLGLDAGFPAVAHFTTTLRTHLPGAALGWRLGV
mmetsp:Transcript_11822/g.37635  ORF Transcript_11822/g.37635 Transcript_11822/m.37635 type:complete len:133 (+) Transcript_11822:1316-1714(+)